MARLLMRGFGVNGPHQDLVMAQVREDFPFVLTKEEYAEQAVAAARKKSIAIGFLKRAGKTRYGGLWIELNNQFTCGQDHYPNNLMGAYNLLLNSKAPSSWQQGGANTTTQIRSADLLFYRTGLPSLALMVSCRHQSSATIARDKAIMQAYALWRKK
jgi:hypothetical protein